MWIWQTSGLESQTIRVRTGKDGEYVVQCFRKVGSLRDFRECNGIRRRNGAPVNVVSVERRASGEAEARNDEICAPQNGIL